jgi:ribonucleoside-diphosphate reductase alpha chain
MDIMKRNGLKEELIFSKLKKVIYFACDGYDGCDALELETALLPIATRFEFICSP